MPGITRYHRAGCILIRFLGAEDLETMTKQAAEEAGCVPCKACRPEQEPARGRGLAQPALAWLVLPG